MSIGNLIQGGVKGIRDFIHQYKEDNAEAAKPPVVDTTGISSFLEKYKQEANGVTTDTQTQPEQPVTPDGKRQLIIDESSGRDHLKAYKDSKGISTIGHGFNLEEPSNAAIFKEVTGMDPKEAIEGKPITVEQQNKLLDHTIAVAEADAKKLFSNYDRLDPNQQDALVNFVFNVGLPTASKFKNTIRHIGS